MRPLLCSGYRVHAGIMPMVDQPITRLLHQLAEGDRSVDDRLARAVIAQLERIAGHELSQRHRDGLHGLTLEPGIFAHDALLKILAQRHEFENRRHFFAYATNIIVRAMIDYHRSRNANKRGGDHVRVSLADWDATASIDIEQIPPILAEFELLDPRKADGVRLRVFWGAESSEIADLLGISTRSVERDWRFSKRWLAMRLRPNMAAPVDGVASDD